MGYFFRKDPMQMLVEFCADTSRYLHIFQAEDRSDRLQQKEDDIIEALHNAGASLERYETARDALLDSYHRLAEASVTISERERFIPMMEEVATDAIDLSNALRSGISKGNTPQNRVLKKHVEKLDEIAAEATYWQTADAQELGAAFVRTSRRI